ncbi:VPS13A_C [Mytilus coruscus]|uniref:VPS13A_C n=1 Tax=Mytilus coruscus TaxID=42192 RepID=A0A6J8EU68_MYTCO|nr:VPS13A_C [Mytilus coruscus]
MPLNLLANKEPLKQYEILTAGILEKLIKRKTSDGCGGEGIQEIICSYAMKLFLKSAGVVIANAQEVSLTLDCFKGKRKFYNLDEIKKEVIEHYKSQAEEQWYMFLFGAEVLGSPVGVCRGIADGAKDLVFKPYEGAKQGPDKFVKGIADGVGSLFDHTVDGAAGSASKITGVLGKAAAASTFDDDYQKKRRQQMRNKQHASASERLASGGKGVVQGVFDGVTGIVRKPYQGAKKERVGGFFKGIGKGIVGVVTRPASGIIDLASESFEEIKRVAIPQVDVRRQRKPRMFSVDKIIRPYNKQEADGFMIMQETDEGKFASSDQFIAHAITSKNCRYVLILTDKRVIYANRGEILGNWDAEWSYTWGEIKEIPKRTLTGIEIVLTAKEGIFGKGYAKKDVRIFDSQTADVS